MISFFGLALALTAFPLTLVDSSATTVTIGVGGSTVAVTATAVTAAGFRLSTFLTSDILTDTMDSCELKFMGAATVFKCSRGSSIFLWTVCAFKGVN